MSKPRPSVSWRSKDDIASRPWAGKKREYDLFKELTVGVIVVGILVVGLSVVFSSPDEPSVTLQQWAQKAPADFITTTVAELGGTSDTAGYGPPYNTTPDATQTVGPLDLQSFSGTRIPIDTTVDFVTAPLAKLPNPPAELATWNGASADQRTTWASAYADAIAAAPDADPAQAASGD